MPTYEYRCPEGHEFEKFVQKMSDAQSELTCPVCGALAQRRMSAGGGLLFKGSGFYITDYGKDGKKDQRAAAAATGEKSGGASDASRSDSPASSGAASKSDSGASGSKSASTDAAKSTSGAAPASGAKPAAKSDKPKSGPAK